MDLSHLRRPLVGGVAALALAGAGASTALAATVIGTEGNDRLGGTRAADSITGLGGDDRLFAGRGADAADGGAGADRIAGGFGDDVLTGGPGDDVVFANRGVDVVSGGEGNDVLWAMARKDARRAGVDTVRGDAGDDRIRVRDGEPDVVSCGAGVDRANLDRVDVIEDATAANPSGSCEVVKRRAPRPGEDRAEGDEGSSPGDERTS